MKILLDDIENNKNEFEEIHACGKYYGGSSVANICGVGYNSPLQEWMRRTGKAPGVEVTSQMELGNYMEPFLLNLFENKVGAAKLVNQVWQSEEHDWMIASPDAVFIDDPEPSLIEFKTHKIYAEKYWSEETASDSALCQLQWYLGVSNLKGGYCAALIGGDTEKFYTPYFNFNKEMFEAMAERVEDFRELVRQDIPPEAGAKDSEEIKTLIDIHEAEVDLTKEFAEEIEEYFIVSDKLKETKDILKKLENKKKGFQNKILLASDGANRIKIGDHLAKCSTTEIKERVQKAYSYNRVNIKRGKSK